MIDVQCPKCSASYNIAEKRIPANGMQMKCPKCGERFQVAHPGAAKVPRLMPPSSKKPLFAPATADIPPLTRPSGDTTADPLSESFGDDDGFGMLEMDLPLDVDGDDSSGSLPVVVDHQLPALKTPGKLPVPRRKPQQTVGMDVSKRPPTTDVGPPLAAPLSPSAGPSRPGLGATNPGGFEADLPMAIELDLPSPVAPGGHAGGFTDLPSPADRPGDNLPSPKRAPSGSTTKQAPGPGYQDLPVPKRKSDNQRTKMGGMAVEDDNLPSPGGLLPSPANRIELPSLAADLPTRSHRTDLPTSSDRLDLPSVADALPVPKSQGERRQEGSDFDDDLFAGAGTAALASGDELSFELDDDDEEDQLTVATDAPGAGGQDQGDDDLFGDDFAADEFDADGAFTDKDVDGTATDRGELQGAPPTSIPPDVAGAGEEFDVDAAQRPGTGPLPAQVGEAAATKKAADKKGSRKKMRLALAALPILAVGGGLLNFTDAGPYGYHAIRGVLSQGERNERTSATVAALDAAVATDVFAPLAAATKQSEQLASDMPRHLPALGLSAYAAAWQNLRFGGVPAVAAMGKQLLTRANEKEYTDTYVELATAANLATDGKLPAARGKAKRLTGRSSEAVFILGEIELRANNGAAAEKIWAAQAKKKKSARSLFGLARAQDLLGKDQEAIASCESVLKLSKMHAGARTLLARQLFEADGQEERPNELLKEVTGSGAVRKAASSGELVMALSLLGDIDRAKSRLSDARKNYDAALKLNPQSEWPQIGKGELFFDAGRFSEALSAFEIAARNPANILANLGIAKSLIALENPIEAQQRLKALEKQKIDHPLIAYWIGQSQEAAGHRKKAEATYRAALKKHPKSKHSVTAYVALANLLLQKGERDEAEQVLADASTNLPKTVELHQAKGSVALASGRLEMAKTEFIAGLALDEKNLKTKFMLAVAYRRLKDVKAAKATLKAITDVDANYPGIALEQGLLYEETGDNEQALAMYNAALKKAPDDLDLKLRVGSTQVVSGHPQPAIALLRQVLVKRSRSSEVNHFLGRAILLAGGSPQEALGHLSIASRQVPENEQYQVFTAWAANEAGKLSVAETAIEKALEINKESGDAHWQRGVLLQKRQQTVDAIQELRLALELRPHRYAAHATLALCYEDQSNYGAAEAAWRKAVAGDDQVPEWHYRLGKILFERGDRAAASSHLGRAIELIEKNKVKAPGWLWNAYFLLGEALRGSDAAGAAKAYRAFLRVAGPENAYIPEAKKALEALGQ